jgi:hypothetical protein
VEYIGKIGSVRLCGTGAVYYILYLIYRSVKLLDAVAEVAELPDYLPGRREIPLSLETMVGESYASGLRQHCVKKR